MAVNNWQKNRQNALTDIEPFITEVYRDMDGMLAIVTKDEYGKLNSERWFDATQLDSAIQYCAARWDEDVYFSVSTFPPLSGKSSQSSRVSSPDSRTRVVYADADSCPPEKFRLKPSIIMQTSPGRWHCLWLLEEVDSGQKVAELSAKVSLAHAADGCDKHARDTKILRVPGTTNTKYTDDWTVQVEYTGTSYTYDDFAAAYEDVVLNLPAVRPAGEFSMAVYTTEQLDTLKKYADAVWGRARLDLDREAEKGWEGDGWDNTAYRVACTLARAVNTPWARRGLPEAVLLMEESKLNDGTFHAASKLDRAVVDVDGEMLHLPEWAELYQTVELPEPDESTRAALEERIDRAGFTQWYVSVPQDGDARRFIVDLMAKAKDAGFTDEETYATVLWSSVFRQSGVFTKEGVWLYLVGSNGMDEETLNSIPLPQGGTGSWHHIPPLLSDTERAWCIANPSFADEYTEWVATTGTDAATVYQRTLAFTILSSVYGDIGFLRLPYGDFRLNMYAMVLGDSTLTRKTAAINRMMVVIHEYEDRSGRVIDLTSNATVEALNRALANANGETRLMWTDEIQGFLDEISTKKYLAGFLGTLAKLYDGRVDASLRVSQGAGNARAEITFNFIGVGIRKHVADSLTTRNYESGLMPRFVWAVADPPPFTENAMAIEVLDEDRENDTFNQYASVVTMCNRFIATRRKLDETAFKPVRLTPEAVERYNAFGRVVAGYLKETDQHEYLAAALLRYGMSVQKAAALLAMYDGSREVTIHHMLHAIRQGEFWLRDMVRMANEVASSDFDRQVDEMEKFVLDGKGHQRTYQEVRNRFRSLRLIDFNELVGNLAARGRIKYDRESGTVTGFMV